MKICDSYSESTQTDQEYIYDSNSGSGQSFTGDGRTLDSCVFYMKKSGSGVTGNIICEIYAHTGTFGVDGEPTGAALATTTVSIPTLSTSYGLIKFTFHGANRITLVNGTKYFTIVRSDDVSDSVLLGMDNVTVGHAGNIALQHGYPTWTSYNSWDIPFYVYTVIPVPMPSFYN